MKLDQTENTSSSDEVLVNLIMEMAITISKLTDDMGLKALVHSTFDTMSAEEVLDELREINNGFPPDNSHLN